MNTHFRLDQWIEFCFGIRWHVLLLAQSVLSLISPNDDHMHVDFMQSTYSRAIVICETRCRPHPHNNLINNILFLH